MNRTKRRRFWRKLGLSIVAGILGAVAPLVPDPTGMTQAGLLAAASAVLGATHVRRPGDRPPEDG